MMVSTPLKADVSAGSDEVAFMVPPGFIAEVMMWVTGFSSSITLLIESNHDVMRSQFGELSSGTEWTTEYSTAVGAAFLLRSTSLYEGMYRFAPTGGGTIRLEIRLRPVIS